MTKKYNLAALGGTFDHFHKGHKTLIDHALSVAHEIVIGVTHQELVSAKSYADHIEPFQQRFQTVRSYLGSKPATVVPLSDIYGPTLSDPRIDCLVVSPLTQPGAVLINHKRSEANLGRLPIKVCHLEKSSDGIHLSSTRIRQGEIDRDGGVYTSLFEKAITVTEQQKQALKSPLGTLITNPQKLLSQDFKLDDVNYPKPPLIVCVGDATSLFCYQHHLPIDLYIFDNQIARKPIEVSIQTHLPANQILTTSNPAGTIQPQFVQALTQAVKNHNHIHVQGEEDLTLLPCIMVLPLGTIVLYGQPNEGIVKVVVSEERKEWVRRLLTNVSYEIK